MQLHAAPGCCEEASTRSHLYYIPCNRPAEWIVKHGNQPEVAMCDVCAYHNMKNRGATSQRPYQSEGYVSPFPPASASGDTSPGLPSALDAMFARYDEAEAERKRREDAEREARRIANYRPIDHEAVDKLNEMESWDPI